MALIKQEFDPEDVKVKVEKEDKDEVKLKIEGQAQVKAQVIEGQGQIPEPLKFRQLFVARLRESTNEEILKDYFETFGKVEAVKVVRCYTTRRSRGYGFVTFAAAETVDKCQARRPHFILGNKAFTKRCLPHEETRKVGVNGNRTIFVAGIPTFIQGSHLEEYFKQFGIVEKVTKIRSFAFVQFDDSDVADKIIIQGEHKISGKYLNVERAVAKSTAGHPKFPPLPFNQIFKEYSANVPGPLRHFKRRARNTPYGSGFDHGRMDLNMNQVDGGHVNKRRHGNW